MKIRTSYYHREKFLPNKKCKNTKVRFVENSIEVEIKEVEEKDFPIAFIVHDYKDVCEGAKTYEDFGGAYETKMIDEEIRTYNGEFYKPLRVTLGSLISTRFESVSAIEKNIDFYKRWRFAADDARWFTDKSVIVGNDMEECKQEILEITKDYVIFNNNPWIRCKEPVYLKNGSEYHIVYGRALGKYISNALETDKLNLDERYIEVLIPEMVTKRLALSGEQALRRSKVLCATLDYCKVLAENEVIDKLSNRAVENIAKLVAQELVADNIPVRFPSVEDNGEKQYIQEYYDGYKGNE